MHQTQLVAYALKIRVHQCVCFQAFLQLCETSDPTFTPTSHCDCCVKVLKAGFKLLWLLFFHIKNFK